jgi:hypothetical protein
MNATIWKRKFATAYCRLNEHASLCRFVERRIEEKEGRPRA